MNFANANVVRGDSAFVKSSEYHMPSTADLESMANLVRRGGSYLQRVYRQCADSVSDRVANFRTSEMGRRLSAAIYKMDSVSDTNTIRRFNAYEQLFGAPECQHSLLRVAPGIQKALRKGLLDGYEDRTVDYYGDLPLEQNPDYQRIYSGIGIEDDEGISFVNYANNYDQTPTEELFFEQKAAMIDNHAMLEFLLEEGIDGTSPYGDKI